LKEARARGERFLRPPDFLDRDVAAYWNMCGRLDPVTKESQSLDTPRATHAKLNRA
jgi:hypothetical protein